MHAWARFWKYGLPKATLVWGSCMRLLGAEVRKYARVCKSWVACAGQQQQPRKAVHCTACRVTEICNAAFCSSVGCTAHAIPGPLSLSSMHTPHLQRRSLGCAWVPARYVLATNTRLTAHDDAFNERERHPCCHLGTPAWSLSNSLSPSWHCITAGTPSSWRRWRRRGRRGRRRRGRSRGGS